MVIPDCRADYRRVTEHFAADSEEPARLAWLSGTQIAALSRRINGYHVQEIMFKGIFILAIYRALLSYPYIMHDSLITHSLLAGFNASRINEISSLDGILFAVEYDVLFKALCSEDFTCYVISFSFLSSFFYVAISNAFDLSSSTFVNFASSCLRKIWAFINFSFLSSRRLFLGVKEYKLF